MDRIELLKITAYLNKYNPSRTQECALSSGISSSVRHNALYTPNCKNIRAIHNRWKQMLTDLGGKYLATKQTIETFKKDVLVLRDNMNSEFINDFKSKKYSQHPGFRLAHSQKSLSVYIKHLWSIEVEKRGVNNTVPECPVCPMDRRMLYIANCPDIRWGSIDTMEEYESKLNYMINAAHDANMSLVRWELKYY